MNIKWKMWLNHEAGPSSQSHFKESIGSSSGLHRSVGRIADNQENSGTGKINYKNVYNYGKI